MRQCTPVAVAGCFVESNYRLMTRGVQDCFTLFYSVLLYFLCFVESNGRLMTRGVQDWRQTATNLSHCPTRGRGRKLSPQFKCDLPRWRKRAENWRRKKWNQKCFSGPPRTWLRLAWKSLTIERSWRLKLRSSTSRTFFLSACHRWTAAFLDFLPLLL